jgi:hypothetical protein
LNYDFSQLPPGFYIVGLEDINGHLLAREKFVVASK